MGNVLCLLSIQMRQPHNRRRKEKARTSDDIPIRITLSLRVTIVQVQMVVSYILYTRGQLRNKWWFCKCTDDKPERFHVFGSIKNQILGDIALREDNER
jgi:hypothetical protein